MTRVVRVSVSSRHSGWRSALVGALHPVFAGEALRNLETSGGLLEDCLVIAEAAGAADAMVETTAAHYERLPTLTDDKDRSAANAEYRRSIGTLRTYLLAVLNRAVVGRSVDRTPAPKPGWGALDALRSFVFTIFRLAVVYLLVDLLIKLLLYVIAYARRRLAARR